MSYWVNGLLIALLVAVGVLLMKKQRELEYTQQELARLRVEHEAVKKQLEIALLKLTEAEAESTSDSGLVEKAVRGLVGLGVPGLVLLFAMWGSGLAGAAAITASLALLGGPAGMLGGIAVLILLGLVSRAAAKKGFPTLVKLVIKGLVAAGHSREDIRRKVESYPTWVVSKELRTKICGTLSDQSISKAASA